MNEPITRNEWIAYGLKRGWVTTPLCLTHDHPHPETGGMDFGARWQIEPCQHVLPLVTDE